MQEKDYELKADLRDALIELHAKFAKVPLTVTALVTAIHNGNAVEQLAVLDVYEQNVRATQAAIEELSEKIAEL